MQLENSFTVPVPVDEAWRVLLDIERIAPCMPGAALDSVEGDSFTGRVKVKLGPINLTYQGKASFIEKDEAAHKAVIDGRGKDQRGNGTAAALITAQLKDEGSSTRVDVLTDLNITGRPAQFGRGVMTDVGNKLLGQFADKLAAQLGEGDAQGDAARAEAARVDAPGSVTATATATGVVEEVAASVEQTPGDNAVAEKVRQAGTATREAAAAATDRSTGEHTAAADPPTTPITAAGSTDTAPATAVAAGGDTAPATTGAAPSGPPSGPTAPPTRPATGAPPRSTPSAAPRPPAAEPEPIDLLEVAGGAAAARFAAPAAGVAAVLLLVVLVVRRRRRR
ncbi:Carbon monoxide dehydrogenase subunit G [Geodermatophilus telluris]|uniref:Carbon monoxide dehydrogenase subunit G n=1 Tax=Geodermatophilus telluris TaxID=1190417 RepID=A0A1G6JS66_9ACTN|nr:SRPBCC family protein [Geodermatophilus telluris]SDC21543.1 Carbon monoxide dehydrogenase subunit G [Geodermatophilus telluris]